MLLKLLLAFTLIPILELFLLIRVGTVIGAGNTVLVVLLTAVAGALLAKQQGAQTFMRIKRNLAVGKMPAEEVVDAFLIFAAGILLITPGFLSDLAGILFLVPRTRRWLKSLLRKRFSDWTKRRTIYVQPY